MEPVNHKVEQELSSMEQGLDCMERGRDCMEQGLDCMEQDWSGCKLELLKRLESID